MQINRLPLSIVMLCAGVFAVLFGWYSFWLSGLVLQLSANLWTIVGGTQ